MIPEHIKKILVNGDVLTSDLIIEIRTIIKEQYPNFARFFSDGAIEMYNHATSISRKQTGAMILKYLK
jgi:hypothetical protein